MVNFDIFAQNIDCGYTLELPLPRRGSSNKYPQSVLWNENKKNRYTPANPYIKVGFKGVSDHGHVFLMMLGKHFHALNTPLNPTFR